MKAFYGKPIWLKSKRMRKDFNGLTDFSLAYFAEPQEIDATFRSLPWMKRLDVNGITITREQWLAERRQNEIIKNGSANLKPK